MAEVVRTYFDKEQTKLAHEYYQVDGKKEGEYKSYYSNGQLYEICNYVDANKNGKK